MKKRKSSWKKWLWIVSICLLLVVILVFLADITISRNTKNYIYKDINQVPENKVGLVLGASKYIGERPNYYFKYRIDAALELYHAGKIRYIVVSGDNGRKTYNEPEDMKNDLIAGGIPDSVIYLDYAGFRTLDSVVRINKIFGQNSFTVISQPFHNERAVYIARKYGLDARGYNAKDVGRRSGFKTMQREKLARVKVFIDMLTGKKPKFLGEEIEIG